MSSRTGSAALALLAALWSDSLLFGAAGPRCDDGKLSLERDLAAAHWDCPGSIWPESSTRPARKICMNESISYTHAIPNSGAYRPVGAESGEYLYCPPQRWLNNLHRGATVLLYHPCAPLQERLLLSVLARSCLSHYVVTSHPHLEEHMPIALVSWGRTLELSTAASSDICGWLETTASGRRRPVDEGQSRGYDLLLTRSAERRRANPEGSSANVTESLRRCFKRIMSSPLKGGMETERQSSRASASFRQMKEDGKRRFLRAAAEEIQEKRGEENQREDAKANQTRRSPISRTGPAHNNNSTPGASADPAGSTAAPFQSKTRNTNRSLTAGPRTSDGSPQPAAQQLEAHPNPPAGLDALAGGVNREQHRTARPEGLKVVSSKAGQVQRSDGVAAADRMEDEEVVSVRERELAKTHSDAHSHHRSETTDSTSEPQRQQPQRRQNPAPRTLRTDEAVWAAAALGFLLVLLALSVLHTRLYRHWRTMPSLYWRDPQQDYDSVADVIRRRLPAGSKRRKRGRRPECVLLPSSSSSDEHC
uniref:Tumor protein p53-inducible protein 13 n=1 Tax=Gasterosteus aculeatus aculeatus TaxID=481459 RepID=A0AAQ4NRK6_GASAC